MKKVAKIKNTKLDVKNGDIVNFWIFFDYEESGTMGRLTLDDLAKNSEYISITTKKCFQIMLNLMSNLKIYNFSEMVGKRVVICGREHEGSFIPLNIFDAENYN